MFIMTVERVWHLENRYVMFKCGKVMTEFSSCDRRMDLNQVYIGIVRHLYRIEHE